ncbi:hypothetical protein COCON_G00107830 [Conger conger]|uniref:Uncharacterized protein n=1 Tax=Conger conger TaxID=82655 RepID=A0A9Q1DJ03_CONCO|nr:hypothetical protein COCON_G00107830 [Conger conger]
MEEEEACNILQTGVLPLVASSMGLDLGLPHEFCAWRSKNIAGYVRTETHCKHSKNRKEKYRKGRPSKGTRILVNRFRPAGGRGLDRCERLSAPCPPAREQRRRLEGSCRGPPAPPDPTEDRPRPDPTEDRPRPRYD